MSIHCARIPKILMPKKGTDLSKWSTVACDQYTSQPEYWSQVNDIVGTAPSTLHLTLPEVYLESPDCDTYIENIHAKMQQYLQDETLKELNSGIVLLERDTGKPFSRRGLVLAFDLETYEYTPGSASPIRPTEKTVVERIPPRLKVRKGAPIELPHIMLLIDDPNRSIIEPLYEARNDFEKLYDVNLMQNGGHLSGWFIPEGDQTNTILEALAHLSDAEVFREKYKITSDEIFPLPYAVGDGNHSMATAKAYWEALKPTLSADELEHHPARYVLAEVVNIHDESIIIEGIYRVLFGVDTADVLSAAVQFFNQMGCSSHYTDSVPEHAAADTQVFPFITEDKCGWLIVENSKWSLPVASLQAFLDDYLQSHREAKIDYIHGLDVLHELSSKPTNIGFELPPLAKEDLFRGVIFDGVLPRKTFSMGDAREKRFYMEAKKII